MKKKKILIPILLVTTVIIVFIVPYKAVKSVAYEDIELTLGVKSSFIRSNSYQKDIWLVDKTNKTESELISFKSENSGLIVHLYEKGNKNYLFIRDIYKCTYIFDLKEFKWLSHTHSCDESIEEINANGEYGVVTQSDSLLWVLD